MVYVILRGGLNGVGLFIPCLRRPRTCVVEPRQRREGVFMGKDLCV